MKRKIYIKPQTEVVEPMHQYTMQNVSFPVKDEIDDDKKGYSHGGGDGLDDLPEARQVNLWDDPGDLWR